MAPRTPKMFVPITPPLNLLADFYHLFSHREFFSVIFMNGNSDIEAKPHFFYLRIQM